MVPNPLLIIVGPTAVGKTEFSLSLAQEIRGEIISADSMQIYQRMDIGTAKPSFREQAMVKHHLIDCIPPDQEFTVADYQKQVDELIPIIRERGAIPMLVGGTGLYVQAVTEGFMFPEMETDWAFREEMHQLAEARGTQAVHDLLREVDPELAEKLHPNDLRRVIRGIEVFRQTGQTTSYFQKRAQAEPPRYNTIKIGLTRPREELYERINLRVDAMIEAGLLKEVADLLALGYSPDLISMQGLGYKEIVTYLTGQATLTDAVDLLKQNTRHFAKRQITWFKRDAEIVWFDPGQMNVPEMVGKVQEMMEDRWHTCGSAT